MSAYTSAESAAVSLAAPNEVLAVRLGSEEYGIDILRVQEIRSFEPPTRMAGAPQCVLGVTNLRGVIVPIVDLRLLLGLPAMQDGAAVTVVLNLGQRTLGAVADGVADVLRLAPEQIKPAPAFDGAHVHGIATVGQGPSQRMLILMDVARLLAGLDAGLV